MKDSYEITAKLNLETIVSESRDVAQTLNEFADNLEQIEKKYSSDENERGKQMTKLTADEEAYIKNDANVVNSNEGSNHEFSDAIAQAALDILGIDLKAAGKLEDPPIEVGDIVVKTGAVFGEIYGIVTHKENGIYTVMFKDGHTTLVLEDGLHPIGSNYKDLLTKIFEHIK